MVKSGSIAFYELAGQELVLYWRSLPPLARVTLLFDVSAVIPGQFNGRSSRAYLYYTEEEKAWAPGLKVIVNLSN